MPKTTMNQLSYGIESPVDLLEKLRSDAAKLTPNPHPHDVFNFVVTAAVINEWIFKIHKQHRTVEEIAVAKEKCDFNLLPTVAANWISDQTCLPNRHCDVRRHVMNAMCICSETANASKHYHWVGSRSVKAIEPIPIVGNWYQYFFTSRKPDLYIDFGGECYGLSQLRGIVLQFYQGFLAHIHSTQVAEASG
jgi:hypothetical protein